MEEGGEKLEEDESAQTGSAELTEREGAPIDPEEIQEIVEEILQERREEWVEEDDEKYQEMLQEGIAAALEIFEADHTAPLQGKLEEQNGVISDLQAELESLQAQLSDTNRQIQENQDVLKRDLRQ